MNLTDLTAKVTNILIDAPAEVTDEIVNELDAAQAEAEDRYAFSAMYRNDSITFTYPSNSAEAPSDWLRSNTLVDPYYASVVGSDTIIKFIKWIPTRNDAFQLYSKIGEEGAPKYLLDVGLNETVFPTKTFALYPDPDETYIIIVPYVSKLDLPSYFTGTANENWFMDVAWRYLVFKAASECLSLNRDHEESTLYALKAEREFQRLIRQDKRSRLKSDTLAIQRDAGAPFNQRLR